jgi:hypothetical protein
VTFLLSAWFAIAALVLAPQPAPPAHASITRLMVMPAVFAAHGNPGNAGRDVDRITGDVTERVLSAVRARYPGVIVADVTGPIAAPLVDYRAAVAGAGISGSEFHAAADARARGATHLLVPMIEEWTEMRTDDPIGAFTLPHDRVTVTLRLMQLEPAAVAAAATFHNHGRLTLNRGAARLLDDRFRRMVAALVGG